MSRCCEETTVSDDHCLAMTKAATHSIRNGSQHVVTEEVQYEVYDVIDSAVSGQLLRDFWLVLHSCLCPAREKTLVVDDTDEITIHVASGKRIEQGLLSLGREDDNIRQVLESLGPRWR